MRNPQSRVTYGPDSGMSRGEDYYYPSTGKKSHAESEVSETRMIDTSSRTSELKGSGRSN